jgi:hypothetical protein
LRKSRGSCSESERTARAVGGLTVRSFRSYRRPDGRCPAHADKAGLGSHAGVRGGRTPWTGVQPPTAHRPPAGHVVVPAQPPRTRPGTVLPQATAAAEAGLVGVRAARPPPTVGVERALSNRGTAGHFRCDRPPCRPGSGHPADNAAAPVSPGRCGAYGNRSSGWRPLVGCSQRRWARTSRAARRPRSSLRT